MPKTRTYATLSVLHYTALDNYATTNNPETNAKISGGGQASR
jgi:hypothetical protein